MPTKKVVHVEHSGTQPSEPTWKPTPAAKSKATTFRIIALVLWVAAIAIEGFAIFWVLKQHSVNMILLCGAIVAIGIFSIIGSLLWKQANRADPASTAEPVRFFIQNQLGAIIAIIAFLPLILMIYTNKNMRGQQKLIAGGLGAVVCAIAVVAGISFNPPSVQQYDAETNTVIQYTGSDHVFWTKDGSVYHLCQAASAVNQQSKDNSIYDGTVGDAHAAGKDRLTLQVAQELKQCGLGTPIPSTASSPGN